MEGIQTSLFDDVPRFKIKNNVRLIELFAGIGAQAKALERLGVDFEHYKVCEFDRYAVRSYNAIHGTNFEPSDIRRWKGSDLGIEDTDKYTYLLTYSFPCTDLSVAGKMQGMSRNSGTRSGLLWEVERLLKETEKLPQILLMENVPQVCGGSNIGDFEEWLRFLEKLGYANFYKILNAKDYDVPQNRERCYMVSLLGNYWYDFPKPKKLEKRLKDLLEEKVDEKYYLSQKTIDMFIAHTEKQQAKGTDLSLNLPRVVGTQRQLQQEPGRDQMTILLRRKEYKKSDVAHTLFAGYKGITNNEYLNVVIDRI